MSSAVAFTLVQSPIKSPNESRETLSSPAATSSQQYDYFSSTYDKLNGGSVTGALGIDEMRREAGNYVYGDVLEIAIGTGLQSQYYSWPKINRYTGIDSSQGMLQEARSRIPPLAAKSNSKVSIDIQQMNTNKLTFADDQVPLTNI